MPLPPLSPNLANTVVEDDRTGMAKETLKRAFLDNLFYIQGRFPRVATANDLYMALAHTIRDRLLHRWIHSARTYLLENTRTVIYLSAEFLMGPHLINNLINLGIYDRIKSVMQDLGLDLAQLAQKEEEPGLGNGGLGRLAACYLDSLATLQIPAIGYGIRYEFGIFDQTIEDGWQVEITDKWLRFGNPWEIPRAEIAFDVKLGGYTEGYHDPQGRYQVRWIPERVVKGVAYDTPILGYRINTCNTLRLWKAEACESFNFQAFNTGDYYGAVNEKVVSENITKVLYPNDEPVAGKRLRLAQQYFFVSCALQDMIRIYLSNHDSLEGFHHKYAAQLNDTHPSIAVAELMRLLVDEHQMEWEQAWQITTQTFCYTNHTLLPEALERWSVRLMDSLLPRLLEIIYEINHRFLDTVRLRFPGDNERIARMSLIDESGVKFVRMAHLACVGSRAINGVARLHTDLLKASVLKDFYDFTPDKFSNKTNGVTPRRFILASNPDLALLITEKIGSKWICDLERLKDLEAFADEPDFQARWKQIKLKRKQDLAQIIKSRSDVDVRPESMFDIQVKRIHEYKRQHLNVLHIISLYNRIKHNPDVGIAPRTVIFGGKAAPGYALAKLIIKFIHGVADVVNRDPEVNQHLRVAFIPDFNVKNAQPIYPAADLSEQISTAGKEASGTGNMKFALNGALTIGTLDGANIEIREAVGIDNFFAFGLQSEEVSRMKAEGYSPNLYYQTNAHLRDTIDLIQSGTFSRGDRGLFNPLIQSLLSIDPYMVLADFETYIECQSAVDELFLQPDEWARKSILNVARMGFFSSDRSIRQYCEDIWHVEPVPIDLAAIDHTTLRFDALDAEK